MIDVKIIHPPKPKKEKPKPLPKTMNSELKLALEKSQRTFVREYFAASEIVQDYLLPAVDNFKLAFADYERGNYRSQAIRRCLFWS